MSVFGHLDDQVLADLAGGGAATADLPTRERDHLDGCARCIGMIRGHRLAQRLLSAPWQLVAASELAIAGAPTIVPSSVRLGQALRPRAREGRTWPWAISRRRIGILIAMALLALAAASLLLFGGGSQGSKPAVVLCSGNGRVSMVNASTLAVTDLGPGSNPAWSADRRTVAFIDNERVVGVDVATRQRTDLGAWAYEWLAVSRDGRWILLTSGLHREDLSILVDSKTGARRTLSEAGWKDSGPPAWSPTSDRAVMVAGNGRTLLLIDLRDPARPVEMSIVATSGYKGFVAWGPADSIAYMTQGVLETTQADGANPRQRYVAKDGEFVLTPAWSPDGRWIAFALLSAEPAPGQIRVMVLNVESGEVRPLATAKPGLLDVIGWSDGPQTLEIAVRTPTDAPSNAEGTTVQWLRLDGVVRHSIDLGPGVEVVAR